MENNGEAPRAEPPLKSMRLRYPGRCRGCGRELAAGAAAVYDSATRTVLCATCNAERAPESDEEPGSTESELVEPGTAGASARRKYEHLKNAREARIREAHPKAGGLILALSDEPQSTTAWATGARGEELLGARLDSLTSDRVRVLHDRRIPRTRANIDHLVVCPSGVYVIDAKKYRGRPALRAEGGILRPRVEKLVVGTRDCTKLVDGMHNQIGHVRIALESAGLGQIPVTGMLCFVDADWPLVRGDFTISSVRVLWPRKAAEHIRKAGALDASTAQRTSQALASAFPAYL